jgi:sigma-B regulation protein RsbU (phosphoserine phosphatase)
MSPMDGLELCRNVRGHARRNYTYFILLTANVGDTEYSQAMDSGIDDLLPEPVDGYFLTTRLRVAERILASKRRVEDLETLLPICSYCKKTRTEDQKWTSCGVLLAVTNKHRRQPRDLPGVHGRARQSSTQFAE